jgi:energy-coupling factor transporter ATP-binding protein EcfA2
MTNPRNIILVTGRTACGKTTYSTALHRLIKDSLFILDFHDFRDAILEDDKMGGKGHTHPLSSHDDLGVVPKDHDGHFHRKEISTPFPALVKKQILVEKTYGGFFDRLATAHSQSTIVAELGGGKNGHQPDSPYSAVDHSYTTTTQHLRQGDFCSMALHKIFLCIHVVVSDHIRLQRVQRRTDIDLDVANILAVDDFDTSLGQLLHEKNVPVLTINNDRDRTLKDIESLLTTEVLPQIQIHQST